MRLLLLTAILYCLVISATDAGAQDWQAVTGAEELKALFSNTVMTATLKDGVTATATYNADGTGELKAWGDTFPRSWQVKGDDQVCLVIDQQTRCFNIEKDASGTNKYRGLTVDTGETVIFTVDQREITVDVDPDSDAGGASQPSAEEIAAKLANPNAPMASLTLRTQFRSFDGTLPSAGSQNAHGGDIWGVARVLENEYGWSEDEIRGFLGENLLRVYEANWE